MLRKGTFLDVRDECLNLTWHQDPERVEVEMLETENVRIVQNGCLL